MLRTLGIAAALTALATASGCDGFEDRPPAFSYVHEAILAPNCATSNCHSELTAQAGIGLYSRDVAYLQLVGRPCETPPTAPGVPPRSFVVPFEPESSQLVYLLRGDEVDIMPPDVPLPEVEIEIVEQWILEGALCD